MMEGQELCLKLEDFVKTEISSDVDENFPGINCKFCPCVVNTPHCMKMHLNEHHPLNVQCPNCDKKFRSQEVLDKHKIKELQLKKRKNSKKSSKVSKKKDPNFISDYDRSNPFECDKCNKILYGKHSLSHHMRQHFYAYKCKNCKQKYLLYSKFKLHRKICQSSYGCTECSAVFKTKQLQRIHINSIHFAKFVCRFCGKGFSTKSSLDMHERRHLNYRPFTCDFCQKSFHFKPELAEHVETIHLVSIGYECKVCHKKLRSKKKLCTHLTIHDPRYRKHVCNICDARFYCKAALTKHFRTHTGEKPYECPLCKQNFTRQYHLKRHTDRIHKKIDDKKFLCPYCEKRFHANHKLQRHIYTHTGEKPFMCDLCGRGFAQLSQMRTHKLMIHKVLPYQCNQCGEEFKIKGDLNIHIAEHKFN